MLNRTEGIIRKEKANLEIMQTWSRTLDKIFSSRLVQRKPRMIQTEDCMTIEKSWILNVQLINVIKTRKKNTFPPYLLN